MTISLKKNFFLTLLLIICAVTDVTGQTSHSVNVRQGLSSMFVLSVYQDCRGYIWAGTYSGLSILDGNGNLTAFTDRPELKAEAGAMVLDIGGTDDGTVWLNTNFGLDCWNIDTGRYEHHPQFSGNYHIAVGPKGQVVILSRNHKLYAYNACLHSFLQLKTDPVSEKGLHAMNIDATGMLRLVTDTCTLEYQLEAEADGHIVARKVSRSIHKAGRLISAKSDNDKLIMINEQGVLYEGDRSGRHARRICQLSPEMLSSKPYSAILKDGADYLIGLYNRGVYRIRKTDQGYSEEPTSITCGIFGIIRDTRQSILWLATDGEGLRYITHEPYEIHNELYSRLPFSVSTPVRAIAIDDTGDLWVGTKGDGLIRYIQYSPHHIQALQYTMSNSSLLHDAVYSLCLGSNDIMWIGSDGNGINYYNPREGRIMRLDIHHPQLRSVHALAQVKNDELYACTGGDGVFRISLEWHEGTPHATGLKQLFFNSSLPTSSNFTSMAQGNGVLWFANREIGIRSLDLKTGTSRLYRPRTKAVCAKNDPISLCYDSISGKLACGMSRGLVTMQPRNGSYAVRDIGRAVGLPDATARAILLEGSRLWAATTQGLAYYDLQTGENSIISTQNALSVLEPGEGASFYDARRHEKYFGTTNGFVMVSAPLRTSTNYIPPVLFTGIRIGNRYIGWDEKIQLKHNQNYLNISFTAVDYLHADSYLFEYRMINSPDSIWHSIGHARNLNFVDLKPGTYTLQVRYHKGQYFSRPAQLTFHISPPWYDTTWARILWLLILVCSVAGSIRLYRWQRRFREQRRQQMLLQQEREAAFQAEIKHRDLKLEQLKALTEQLNPFDVVGDRVLHREDHQLLEQIFQIVIDEISNPDLSPKLVADKLCMGYRTLYRRLQNISDKTLANIIRDIRMEHACQLLSQTRMTTEQVALQVGYLNRGSFHKHFATHYGCTPRQFQAQLQSHLSLSAEKAVQSKDKPSVMVSEHDDVLNENT